MDLSIFGKIVVTAGITILTKPNAYLIKTK